MLSTVARCARLQARQIRCPSSCCQNIPLRAQTLTKKKTQKWHVHTRKYSQLRRERNVVGVRNESSKSTDGQNELLTWVRY